uniref:PX domain-containing protein n=1 Tax=Photinus pyralis TaxID=7054 RepID=A0A1Y1KD91_PHOPY
METSTHTRTLSRSTTLSDDDFDDKLDVPPVLLTMISVEGKPVLVEDDENDYKTDLVDAIPFSTIFTSSGKFKSYQRKIFVPGLDVTVAIEQSDRNLTSHFLNPNLYTITLTHGDFTWQVKRRYKHIQHLHQQLVLFRTSLNIPFPTKTHRQRRDNFKNNAVVSKSGKRKGALPRNKINEVSFKRTMTPLQMISKQTGSFNIS